MNHPIYVPFTMACFADRRVSRPMLKVYGLICLRPDAPLAWLAHEAKLPEVKVQVAIRSLRKLGYLP